jgi:hypothetical protein
MRFHPDGCSGAMAPDGAMAGLRPGKGEETDPTEEKPHARVRWGRKRESQELVSDLMVAAVSGPTFARMVRGCMLAAWTGYPLCCLHSEVTQRRGCRERVR